MPTPDTILHVRDCDDGATVLDVVEVPEGYSFQIADVTPGATGYTSVIVSPEDAARLRTFLGKRTSSMTN
jgi:hypothetical protein